MPWGLAAGAAIGIGGSVAGGMLGSSSAKKKAAAIQAAGDKAAGIMQQGVTDANAKAEAYNNMARGDLSPFRDFGVRAGTSLTDLLLGGGDVSAMLKASPLFNFQSQMGTQAINRQLAARGLYGSGAGLQTLSQFNDQLVGEEGQRLVDRLFNLTQLGSNSATNMASMTNNVGQFMAGNIYNGSMNRANLLYNSALGVAGAQEQGRQSMIDMTGGITNALSSAVGGYTNMNMLSGLMGSMGGGSGAGSQKTRGADDILFNFGGMTGGGGGGLPFSMTGG